MNSKQNLPVPDAEPPTSRFSWLAGVLPALLFTASELIALWLGGNNQLWIILPVFIAILVSYWLVKTGRPTSGNLIFIIAIGLQAILVSIIQKGSGVPNAIIALTLIMAMGLGTLPRRHMPRLLLAGVLFALASILLDAFGNADRTAAVLIEGRWIFAGIMLVLAGVFLARQLFSLDIRTKIVTGILGTGALALGIFIFFALNQTGQLTDALSDRLEESVKKQAEEQLINIAFTQASRANESFRTSMEHVNGLAQSWSLLQDQSAALNESPYWDASTKLTQMEEGQFGNSPNDPASVFIPTGTNMDVTMIRDLNVMAYLDFYAPDVLRANPSLIAIYAIDTRGALRYYPNVNLASLVPPDFNPAAQRAYYRITTPLYNPERLPRWAIPYEDAAGGGLVVTVAAPVYNGNRFRGIVAADMQLVGITEQINEVEIEKTGYAYMIDDSGHILSMPDAGYRMFGLNREEINLEELSLLGLGTVELQGVTKLMTSGGSGLRVADVNGVETYISFAPIDANGYSVALVVPVAELQETLIAARNQTDQQKQSTLRTAVVILILLLMVAIAVSIGLGQVIAAPIQHLTQVSTQVASGDLSVQVSATTRDEIGTLAQSFNTMTARLRETLDGLEQRVEERTAALLSANERNERRARQFESIAQVARTISSTRDLDVLLTQITNVISREFNFYHVGIFLLDRAKEYAVLSAANSEGGQAMLKRGHRLRVGEIGLVGYVTGTGKPRVALDVGADATFFNNPDLPDTHSEIALPLLSGEEIIGALDVQSTQPAAFSQEDISILSTLADQVSVAIQNARQFEQTRQALGESEVLARQFVQTGWRQFTKTGNVIGVRHTGARASLIYRKNGREKTESHSDQDQIRPRNRGSFLSLPIKLRGEVIGTVDIRTPDNRPWDDDEKDVVTAIIERAAVAMENARLLAESQKRAAKERVIGEISSKISMQTNINELLKTAAQELGRALPGAEIAVQFNKDTA